VGKGMFMVILGIVNIMAKEENQAYSVGTDNLFYLKQDTRLEPISSSAIHTLICTQVLTEIHTQVLTNTIVENQSMLIYRPDVQQNFNQSAKIVSFDR
jgi:hypothetical protein